MTRLRKSVVSACSRAARAARVALAAALVAEWASVALRAHLRVAVHSDNKHLIIKKNRPYGRFFCLYQGSRLCTRNFKDIHIFEFPFVDLHPDKCPDILPSLDSCGSGVDEQSAVVLVIHDLEYVRVSADKQVGNT